MRPAGVHARRRRAGRLEKVASEGASLRMRLKFQGRLHSLRGAFIGLGTQAPANHVFRSETTSHVRMGIRILFLFFTTVIACAELVKAFMMSKLLL